MTPVAPLHAASLFAALAPELLLAAGAMALLLASVWRPQGNAPQAAEGAERTGAIARFAMLLCLFTMLAVVVAWADGASGTADGRVAADGFRWTASLLVLGGTLLSLVLLDADHGRSGAYGPETPVMMLLAATGMLVLTAARDLMLLFLGLELMSLAVYVLAGVQRRSPRGAEAALKYFLLGAFASGFLLYGMALLFGATGSTRLEDIAAWVATHPGLGALFVVGTALLLVGFAFKIAAVPFHLWTPDVYEGAPLPVAAFMASVVKTAAFAALARVMVESLGGASAQWHPVLWWLAAITMVAGNVLALAQRTLVRLLAYSSIAHAGYLLVAVVANSALGLSALLFYLASYGLATMGAFAVLVTVNGGRDRAPTREDLAGLWHVRPWLAVAMAVYLLAFLGFPLAGGMGFFAKWYLLQAALQASAPQTLLAVVLVGASVVSAGYYLAVVNTMFARTRPADAPVPAPAPLARLLIAGSAVLLLVLGVYPTPVAQLARRATGPAAPASPVQPPAPGPRPVQAAVAPAPPRP
jgi:NADH-quinone oxidoreductase subunit N